MHSGDLESTEFTPADWQQQFLELLPVMHGFGNYTRVPDQDRGDRGLEAFSHDGIAYQCYADQNSYTLSKRYEKQRAKISADLSKFSDESKMSEILGDVMIDRWVLVTPRNETRKMVSFCNSKSKEIRALGLPYVTPTFRVEVRDRSDLKPFIRKVAASKVFLDLPNQVVILTTPSTPKLEVKLARLYPNEDEREERSAAFLRTNAQSQNLLRELRDFYPEVSRRVAGAIRSREGVLVSVGSWLASSPRATLERELQHLGEDIERNAPELSPEDRTTLVLGCLTDWMLRCPLDFEIVPS